MQWQFALNKALTVDYPYYTFLMKVLPAFKITTKYIEMMRTNWNCVFQINRLAGLSFKVKSFLLILIFSALNVCGQSTVKSVSIFDGKTLTGWKTVDPSHEKLWSVSDSIIKSGDGVNKIPDNTYLHTIKEYGNFEFRCLFRLSGDSTTGMINSGIQYRSILEGRKIVGYQADIGAGYWGDIYDEHRRGKLVGGDLRTLSHLLKEDGWNSYIIRCKGNRHELYINGIKTSDYIEKDSKMPQKGVIAVQIHAGGVAQVEFRDLTISEL